MQLMRERGVRGVMLGRVNEVCDGRFGTCSVVAGKGIALFLLVSTHWVEGLSATVVTCCQVVV